MVPLAKRFQLARKKQGVSITQASQALRIRPEFLDAIEQGAYTKLPAAYAAGFIGNYAHYLGMSKQETLAMFRREYDEKHVYNVLPSSMTHAEEFTIKRQRFHQTMFVILGIFLLLCGYILFQYRFIFLSPPLWLDSPKENEVIRSNQIEVRGKTDPNATVTVNNSTVSLDAQGNFSKTVDLFSGKTVIRVSAVNRFGKKSIIEREVDIHTQ